MALEDREVEVNEGKAAIAIPEMWSKMAMERLRQQGDWLMSMGKFMKPYAKGESWREHLNKFVANLNGEAQRKLHPERFYDD